MSEFLPKSNGLGAVTSSTEKRPEVVLPLPGDTMYVAAHPWGGYQVVDEYFVPNKDTKIVELEVKGIKSVKVIYE